MNPTSKKLLSLFLVFSLVMLSANLYAKERRGAKLIITKKDGQQISGELITVKPNSLLLLDSTTKTDISIDIKEIKVFRIKKKLKTFSGARNGLAAGVILAALVEGPDTVFIPIPAAAVTVFTFGFVQIKEAEFNTLGNYMLFGLLSGAIIGSLVSIDKKIQIEGMTDSEIQETMDKLRKKARIRDYK
jgi:hypothetical protein